MSFRPQTLRSHLRSVVALVLCALVFGLGLLAHAPDAHAWLHGADTTCEADASHAHDTGTKVPAGDGVSSDHAGDLDHACVINTFAHGADLPAPTLVARAACAGNVLVPAPETTVLPGRDAHLLPPGRAPPVLA